jgi:hypothetical protein
VLFKALPVLFFVPSPLAIAIAIVHCPLSIICASVHCLCRSLHHSLYRPCVVPCTIPLAIPPHCRVVPALPTC